MLTSQGLVFATAMAVSACSIILFDLFKEKCEKCIPQNQDPKQALKSCLSSGRKKIKKRVQFADDVKDTKGNGELYRREHQRWGENEIEKNSKCGNETLGFKKMPANRAVLYSGMLKDRVQRMEYSY
ncbi:hypothetical protein CDL12_11203 [Handroanthus impetiginosus]|uniref:Uncharacterized protein n=1 Tax=Handroanthus impetiginosus TaxID=429701 RepID=A0A2G9HF27_9LAMI|nr:hypothetical protein CDL12_11203 [Handroanthus impetiginosus]